MTTKLIGPRWPIALAAVLLCFSVAGPHPAAAMELGYEIKCKTSWQKVPNGGYLPDRPRYEIKGRKCVGVPKRPSYLDKPRNPVRIAPPRQVRPVPGYLRKPRFPGRVTIKRQFERRNRGRM